MTRPTDFETIEKKARLRSRSIKTITYALLAFLEHFEDEVVEVPGLIVENGRFYISCKGTEKIATAFYMALLGLRKISSQYPDHVSITYSGIAGDSRE